VTPAFSMRAATPDDADFVLELFARDHVRQFAHGPKSSEDFVTALDRPGKEVTILERDGKPFGNLVLGTPWPWLLELQVIAIAENGHGGGRFAVKYALWRGFDDLKVHRVYLEVVAKNVRARKLYERAGLRAEGFFRDGYRSDDGAYHDLVPYGMLSIDPRHNLLK
jgi:ribosomal protein S18 acetylase RimI-like enzyme